MFNLGMLAYSSIAEIVKTDYPVISRSDTVLKLRSLFYTSGSYEALVTNGDPPSLVTVRDVLKITHPERTSISRIAFKPKSVSVNAPFHEASRKLVQGRVRILPSIDNGSLSGVVRQMEILRKMADCEDMKEFRSEDLMVGKPATAGEDSSVGMVRNIMLEKGISHIPVVDRSGRMRGIITAGDLIWYFVQPWERTTVGERKGEMIKILEMGIDKGIDTKPIHVAAKASVLDAVRQMLDNQKGYCLVLEKRKPVGIITPRDVISLLVEFRARARVPAYVFVSGFKGSKELMIRSIKKKIDRVARKGLKIHPDLQEIVVHGKVASITGDRHRFTLKARALLPSGVLAATASEWSLPMAIDKLCERMDRRLIREKRE